MTIIFDLSVLYILGQAKGMYSIQTTLPSPTVLDCFHVLEQLYPDLHALMKKVNVIDGDTINAMMISGETMLKANSKVFDNMIIKVVGQICGG